MSIHAFYLVSMLVIGNFQMKFSLLVYKLFLIVLVIKKQIENMV